MAAQTQLEAAGARLAALCENAAAAHAEEAPVFSALRARGRRAFAAQGLPHSKLEAWRSTPLTALAAHEFALPQNAQSAAVAAAAETRALFVNGIAQQPLRRAEQNAPQLQSLAGAEILGTLVDEKLHPLAALNAALFTDGLHVHIPEGAQVQEPLHIVFASVQAPGAPPLLSNPRLAITAGVNSNCTLVLQHINSSQDSSAPHWGNFVAEIQLAEGAQLELAVLQQPGAGILSANFGVLQQRDSRFTAHTVSGGGALLRNDFAVQLAGANAQCNLRGLFFGGGESVVDNHTLVEHAVPDAESVQLYKGVLAGRARGVFRGRIAVRPAAQHTKALQQNPNLLLSDACEINTKPQLEIYADDVRCTHGAAIGRLDEDALFYLRARGISAAAARAMLVRAFAAEIMQALPGEALRETLARDFAAQLKSAGGVAQ